MRFWLFWIKKNRRLTIHNAPGQIGELINESVFIFYCQKISTKVSSKCKLFLWIGDLCVPIGTEYCLLILTLNNQNAFSSLKKDLNVEYKYLYIGETKYIIQSNIHNARHDDVDVSVSICSEYYYCIQWWVISEERR